MLFISSSAKINKKIGLTKQNLQKSPYFPSEITVISLRNHRNFPQKSP